MAPEVIEDIRTFLRIPARVHEVPRIRQPGPAGVPATPIPDPPHEHAPSMTTWRFGSVEVSVAPPAPPVWRVESGCGRSVKALVQDRHVPGDSATSSAPALDQGLQRVACIEAVDSIALRATRHMCRDTPLSAFDNAAPLVEKARRPGTVSRARGTRTM